jgi:hypothetical protein
MGSVIMGSVSRVDQSSLRRGASLTVAMSGCLSVPQAALCLDAVLRGEKMTPFGANTLAPEEIRQPYPAPNFVKGRRRGHCGISSTGFIAAPELASAAAWLMSPKS